MESVMVIWASGIKSINWVKNTNKVISPCQLTKWLKGWRCLPHNLKTRMNFLDYSKRKELAISLKLSSDIHLHTMYACTHKHTDVHENTQVYIKTCNQSMAENKNNLIN